ncbi:hypothetical protein [Microvirga sp. G4-2]|uniref:hypothetical protein n=1 Tax=Microvirga sp. G4-2 TaxID=3434467 RepID=UPI00404498F1
MRIRHTVIGFWIGLGMAIPSGARAQVEQYNVCWGQDEKQCRDQSVTPDQTFFACETAGHQGYSSEYVCQSLCKKPNQTGSCETFIRYGRGGGQCGYIWTHVHCY